MAKWIYITVENFNREAHAKLLLAFYGIKQNSMKRMHTIAIYHISHRTIYKIW